MCVCIEFTHISSGGSSYIGYYDDCDGIPREVVVRPLDSEKVCGSGLNISTNNDKLTYTIGEECDENRKCPSSDPTTTTTSFREPDDPTTTTSTTEEPTTTTTTTQAPTTTTTTTDSGGGSGSGAGCVGASNINAENQYLTDFVWSS